MKRVFLFVVLGVVCSLQGAGDLNDQAYHQRNLILRQENTKITETFQIAVVGRFRTNGTVEVQMGPKGETGQWGVASYQIIWTNAAGVKRTVTQ